MEHRTFTVGGVYRDFPRNSFIKNYIYQDREGLDKLINNWGDWSYITFIKIDNPDDLDIIKENFKDALKKAGKEDESNLDYYFEPLKNLHFTKDIRYDTYPKANRETVTVLFLIGFVIIIIAAANFTNFSIALSPVRIKNINTRKVLGASIAELRFSLLMEGVIICLTAFFLSILLIYGLKGYMADLINPEIDLSAYSRLISMTFFIAIFTGFVSAIYPAWYITSFEPVLALKGSFGFSPTGKKLRTVLITVQYIASFALIISVAFMLLQNHYLLNKSVGYNKDRLLITDLNWKISGQLDLFTEEIKSFSGIDDITYSDILISNSDDCMNWGRKYNGDEIKFDVMIVEPSFMEVMGIDITEGRNFREDDKNTDGKLIFNEKARETFGLKLNAMVEGMEIVGFMPDVHYKTFRVKTDPMAFTTAVKGWGYRTNYAYIRVVAGTDMYAARKHVEETLKKMDADWIFNVRFFDEAFESAYKNERGLTVLISIFSIISILISLIGVFGMVVYETFYRSKEISIRKVLGSSIIEVLELFNKTYLKILAVCFIIACPLVYFMIDKWLDNFAYRTPIYIWVFFIAGFLLVLITVITVTWQSWRAATANPAEGFRNE